MFLCLLGHCSRRDGSSFEKDSCFFFDLGLVRSSTQGIIPFGRTTVRTAVTRRSCNLDRFHHERIAKDPKRSTNYSWVGYRLLCFPFLGTTNPHKKRQPIDNRHIPYRPSCNVSYFYFFVSSSRHWPAATCPSHPLALIYQKDTPMDGGCLIRKRRKKTTRRKRRLRRSSAVSSIGMSA